MGISNVIVRLVSWVVGGLIVVGLILGLFVLIQWYKEITRYVERQMEIEALRENGFLQNLSNRDPAEFIEAIPDVRGAADGASADFIRKRDEAVQRFRSRLAD